MQLEREAEALARALGARLAAHVEACDELGEPILRATAFLPSDAQLCKYDCEREHALAFGWALGVISAGLGVDTLCARRERRGLELMASALGAQTPDSASSAGGLSALPSLSPACEHDWQVSFLFAWLCQRTRHAGGLPQLRWKLEELESNWRLCVELDAGCSNDEFTLGKARAWAPGVRTLGETHLGILEVPRDWFLLSLPNERRPGSL